MFHMGPAPQDNRDKKMLPLQALVSILFVFKTLIILVPFQILRVEWPYLGHHMQSLMSRIEIIC